MTAAGSAASGAMTCSIIAGSISGSSPWTFTTMSQDRSAATSAMRSVPVRCVARVILAIPPNAPDRGGDPLVIGRHDHGIHAARGGRAPIDVLDHGTAGDVGERLARETRGVVSSGDDGDDCGEGECSVEGIREPDRVHDE